MLHCDFEVPGYFTGCGFVLHCLFLPVCIDNHGDTVIPRTDTLVAYPPSFLYFDQSKLWWPKS